MIGCWYCYKQPCRFIRDSRRFIVVTRFRQMSLYKRLPPPQLRSEEEQGGMVPPHSWYYRDRAGFQNAKSTCYETNIEETFRYPIRNRQHDIVWIILYTIVLWLLWSNNKRICMLYFAFLEGSIKETNKRLYYQTGYWLLASIIKLDNTFAHLDQPGDNPWVTSRKTGVSDCMFRRLAPLRGRQQPKLAKQACSHHHYHHYHHSHHHPLDQTIYGLLACILKLDIDFSPFILKSDIDFSPVILSNWMLSSRLYYQTGYWLLASILKLDIDI
jgi:hypothetical protein